MNVIVNKLMSPEYNVIWMTLALCISAFVSYSSFPIIIKISKIKGLMHEPGARCSHTTKTPNLGGIGIFLGVITALTFIGSIMSYNNLLCLIGATVLLLFTGLRDDLVDMSPINKLIGQIIASLFIILISDIRIHSFFGVFGIEVLPYFISVIFTLFVFVLIINAFNLIDGVDGLAGSIGIITSVLFGIFFYSNGNHSMFFISISLIGALSTFLVFNFSKTKKVFMGDTGSMIVGFLLAYQGVSFLRMTHNVEMFLAISNPPALIIAIFSFPLMDTLRVFVIRLIKGRSPFSADRNHIHHNLLDLGLKHWEISVVAVFFVFVMAAITYNLDNFGLHTSLLVLVIASGVFSVTPYLVLRLNQLHKEQLNTIYTKSNSMLKSVNKRPKYVFELQKIYTSILNVFI